jgi:ketosteroid isomerase-like protein
MSRDTQMLRDAYEALNREEWDRSDEFMHPEISWDFVEGQGPDVPETLRGPTAIVEFWTWFFAAWEEWEMAPQEFVETPEGTLLVPIHFRAKGAGSGFPMELDFCQVITVREGRIHHVDQYLSRESASKACGLEG